MNLNVYTIYIYIYYYYIYIYMYIVGWMAPFHSMAVKVRIQFAA